MDFASQVAHHGAPDARALPRASLARSTRQLGGTRSGAAVLRDGGVASGRWGDPPARSPRSPSHASPACAAAALARPGAGADPRRPTTIGAPGVDKIRSEPRHGG